MTALRPDWFSQVKAWPVAEVASRLGLDVVRRGLDVSFACPACRKTLRHQRAADKRRAAKVTPTGACWWCEPCGTTGTGVDVAAWLTLNRKPASRDDWEAVRRSCVGVGLCDGLDGCPVVVPAPAPLPPASVWPSAREVADLWGASHRLTTVGKWNAEAWAFLERRGFDVERIATLDAARVLPQAYPWPKWWPGDWSGAWRIVSPAWSPTGEMVSLHGRAIDASAPKTRWPRGQSASGLLLADVAGVGFLRNWDTHSALRGLEGVVVAEGLTDTLKLATALDADASTFGVLGYVAGSAHAFERIRWPTSVPLILALDDDETGDNYAAEIVATLPAGARVWRARPPHGRSSDGKKLGDWSDLSDREAAAALFDSRKWAVLR